MSDDDLVTPEWLVEHHADAELLAVDCRFTGDRESSRAAYRDGHIPGAVHVYWLDELCAVDTRVTTFLPDPARAVAGLGRIGIGPDTLVIAYSDSASLYAARLWQVLRRVGHDRVRLLDGGLDGWTAAGGGLETGDRVAAPATLRLRASLDAAVDAAELLGRLDDPRLQLVDTRSPAEFEGSLARAARGGHIPGATSLPWTDLVDGAGRFLTADALRGRCRQAGLDPAQEIVTYCQGGVRAAHTALALAHAGFPRVRIYDGSWAEWGNDLSLPITEPVPAP